MNCLPLSISSILLLSSFNTYAAETHNQFEPNLWDGFYIGALVGNAHSEVSPKVRTTQDTYFETTDDDQLNPAASKSLSDDDFNSSILIGYNFQKDNIVYGVEGGISFAKFNTNNKSTDKYLTNSDTFVVRTEASADWLMSLRAKIGYTFNDSLLYLSLGPSLTEVKYQFSFSDSFESNSINKSKTAWGLSGGVGYEYKLNRNWSFKADYLISYFNDIDFGKSNLSGKNDGFSHTVDFTRQVLRVGFSRYF